MVWQNTAVVLAKRCDTNVHRNEQTKTHILKHPWVIDQKECDDNQIRCRTACSRAASMVAQEPPHPEITNGCWEERAFHKTQPEVGVWFGRTRRWYLRSIGDTTVHRNEQTKTHILKHFWAIDQNECDDKQIRCRTACSRAASMVSQEPPHPEITNGCWEEHAFHNTSTKDSIA